jgi:translation initiation factor IF-2
MPAKQKTASMGLRFADAKGDYRCLRLPLSGTPAAPAGAPVAPGAPAAESAPPAAAEPSPAPAPSGEAPAPQPAMPAEGAVKKDY